MLLGYRQVKLTLIGGGGVRAPLFLSAALRRAERINLTELCLMDIDAEKLEMVEALCRRVAEEAGSAVRITATRDARAAIADAAYIVTSIRVGGDAGRVHDERIALRHGVLGQETTGPGGFAMALRSIPALLGYAQLIKEINPDAWMLNFTNPAGLVTQALRDAGFERAVGICDGANHAQHAVSRWLGLDPKHVRAELYGLNHLSWARRVWADDKDVLPDLLQNPGFLSGTALSVFAPELVAAEGVWLNEYLYYYYHVEHALESLQRAARTRGEEIQMLNRRLLTQLRAIDVHQHPRAALDAYYAYERRRSATYMHYAHADRPGMAEAEGQTSHPHDATAPGEGYAGVALDIIEAFETRTPLYTGLNVPNEGAIDCMRPHDVVEISCVVDRDGIHPLPVGGVPEAHELLMRAVKRYERLTVEAIRSRSRVTAIMALMAHPLVLSYSRAAVLVHEYLEAHAPYVGEWH